MDGPLQRAVKCLLKAALEAENYAATLPPDEDNNEAVIEYFEHHAMLIRVMANDWLPDSPRDNVVLFRGNPKKTALPPENTRRIRPDPSRA